MLTSEDKGTLGPGESSGSDSEEHFCCQRKSSRIQGFQKKMRGATYVHTDTASRTYCPYLQDCCTQDSVVNHIGFYDVRKSQNLQHQKNTLLSS